MSKSIEVYDDYTTAASYAIAASLGGKMSDGKMLRSIKTIMDAVTVAEAANKLTLKAIGSIRKKAEVCLEYGNREISESKYDPLCVLEDILDTCDACRRNRKATKEG